MKNKAETDYVVIVNGMPNYKKIPKAVLEPITKKILESILKQLKENSED